MTSLTTEQLSAQFDAKIDAAKAEVFEHLELRLREIDERNGVRAQEVVQRQLVQAIDERAA